MRRCELTLYLDGNQAVYSMVQQEDDAWIFSDEPVVFDADTLSVTATAYTTDGQPQLTIQTDDEQLVYTLTNFVAQNQSYYGYRMINYYPVVINSLLEYQCATNALGFEIDFLKCGFTFTFSDAFLTTMGEDRIKEWERILEIVPKATQTLTERRSQIISRIISRFKLNTQTISDMVNLFVDAQVNSFFLNSCIYVYIKPYDMTYTDDWPEIYAELITRVPAHLGLNIGRLYSSWGAVKDNYYDWQAVADQNDSWRTVKFKMYPSDYL